MRKYSCEDFRPVRAESLTDAAGIFALRKARRIYGRNAVVGTLRCNASTRSGDMGQWDTFLGTPSRDGDGIVGANNYLHVYLEEGR